MNRRIVVRRKGLPAPRPGQPVRFGEAVNDYVTVLDTWAAVRTLVGLAEYGQVEVGGQRVTHKLIIRHTDTDIDTRDVVELGRPATHRLAVLGVENLGEQNRYLVINCTSEARI
jgi:head-tail adaptor